MRWLKPIVSLSLYALIFRFSDVGAILGRLSAARLEFVAAGVLLYSAGQALSAWRWRLLLEPVALTVPLPPDGVVLLHRDVLQPVPPDDHRGRRRQGPAPRAGDRRNRRAPRSRSSWSATSDCSRCCSSPPLPPGGRQSSTVFHMPLTVLSLLLSTAFVGVNLVLMHPAIYAARRSHDSRDAASASARPCCFDLRRHYAVLDLVSGAGETRSCCRWCSRPS